MKRLFAFGLMLALFVSLLAPFAFTVEASAPQTYNVLVGWENSNQGVDIEAFFPDSLTIHVGDRVHWIQNSHEIHTVTFLAGTTAPELILPTDVPAYASISPLMFNLAAVGTSPASGSAYNGSGPANSGLMGLDPGQAPSYDLVFTQPGTYAYICLVHGVAMSGKVVVVGSNVKVKSPNQVTAIGKEQIEKGLDKVPAAFAAANKAIQPPTRNSDGSKTYHVMMGYSDGGQIDLMRFFPKNLVVRPGDTVEWSYGSMSMGMSMAPHTVTFLNGAAEPDLALPTQSGSNPFRLLINPAVLFPAQPGQPLSRSGIFNSGLLDPSMTQPYALKIGTAKGLFNYMCLLHDASGMVGTIVVAGH